MEKKMIITLVVAVVAIAAFGGIVYAIMSNQAQGKAINSVEDLEGANIAVQTGTTGDTFVTENYEKTSKANVSRYTYYPDAITDLKNKKVDAIIMDKAVAEAYVSRNSGIKVLDAKLDENADSYAFIFKKTNTELKDKFNEALAELITDGTIEKINKYWEQHDDCQAAPYITETGTGKTLKVGTSPDFEPYDGLYGPTFTGIDMDIIRAICNKLDYKVEFGSYDFDSIILAVDTGYFDVGASGFSITAERAEKVLFSNSYASSEQVAVVRA